MAYKQRVEQAHREARPEAAEKAKQQAETELSHYRHQQTGQPEVVPAA